MIRRYFLIIAVLLFLTECGVRNKTGETNKDSTVQKDESSSKGIVSKSNAYLDESKSKEKNESVSEDVKQTVTELYDENGKLKSRIIELEKQKHSNTSIKGQKSLKSSKTTVDSVFTNKTYRKATITEYKKKVDVESDKTVSTNFGGPTWLIIALIIVVGAIFLYFYLRK